MMDEWVWLARVGPTQGRKGEVWCTVLTDFPEKFADRRRLWLLKGAGTVQETAREVELKHHWPHKGGMVLHFAGVDEMTAAEGLRGQIVAIPKAERAALGEDEFYAGDLIDSTLVDVRTGAPVTVGVIEDVDREAGPVALLVVRGVDGEERLIPLAKAYLRRVDVAGKRVEMELPEGLLEL